MKKKYDKYSVYPDYNNRKCFYHSFNYLVNIFLGVLNPEKNGENFDEGFNTIISTIILEYGDCDDNDDTCVNLIWESINKEYEKYKTGKVRYIKENFNIRTLTNELNELKKKETDLKSELDKAEAAAKEAEALKAEHDTSLSLGLRLIDNRQLNEEQNGGTGESQKAQKAAVKEEIKEIEKKIRLLSSSSKPDKITEVTDLQRVSILFLTGKLREYPIILQNVIDEIVFSNHITKIKDVVLDGDLVASKKEVVVDTNESPALKVLSANKKEDIIIILIAQIWKCCFYFSSLKGSTSLPAKSYLYYKFDRQREESITYRNWTRYIKKGEYVEKRNAIKTKKKARDPNAANATIPRRNLFRTRGGTREHEDDIENDLILKYFINLWESYIGLTPLWTTELKHYSILKKYNRIQRYGYSDINVLINRFNREK
jgi:hypothetical protein